MQSINMHIEFLRAKNHSISAYSQNLIDFGLVLSLEPQLKEDGDNKVHIRGSGLFRQPQPKKWGQFYNLRHQILFRLDLVLNIVIEGWSFACSILMWSSIQIKNTIWDWRSTTSIMTSIKLKKLENTNWFTPTHSFQHDQTIFYTSNKQMKNVPK